jgi:hypothetical protein
MECPYCHAPMSPETPCMAHPPVPMSYWPSRSGMPEMLPAADYSSSDFAEFSAD